ncbi:hypothetical protein EXN22_12940 [Pseudomonas tructae]|uniref:Uncharacterized protein n=1 Tax=Pseudomonas tructae TaxID=2518644 RepID=A0A411MI74_9PSED|nr:hypothetical protein [Pseudomonas tructae]QBF26556.1 hypothetical protein EXN22_12940 [Pseudomonas tructae]
MDYSTVTLNVASNNMIFLWVGERQYTVNRDECLHEIKAGKNRFRFDNMRPEHAPAVGAITMTCRNGNASGTIVFYMANGGKLEALAAGEVKQLTFNVGEEYVLDFSGLWEPLTVINLFDDMNYWTSKVHVDLNTTSVSAFSTALLAAEANDKVLTLGGVRQALDETHGIHLTSIGIMAFLNDKTSADAAKEETDAPRRWFATACSLALYPKQRPGWLANNPGKTFTDEHIKILLFNGKSLASNDVSSKGYIVAGWLSGPRPQWAPDWKSMLVDILFARHGGTGMKGS